MKKTLITMFMLLAGSLALTAAPQSQDQPQTDEQSNPSAQSQTNPDHVTITGCLQEGTTPNTYVLNHAMPGKSSSLYSGQDQNQARADIDQNPDMIEPTDQNQAMNTPEQNDNNSQMPSAEARAENSSYILIPESRVDLKSHIGHKVEITGTMVQGSAMNSESQRNNAPTGQMSQSQSSMQTSGQPEIKVMSIRHIAETCQ